MKYQHPVTAQALRERTGSSIAAELGVDLTALSRWQLAALALEAVELVRLGIDSACGSPRADAVHAAHYLRSLRSWYE